MADNKTLEEIAAEKTKAEADAKASAEAEGAAAIDPLVKKDEEIRKLQGERDNYKNIALKRLGKLPGDADFLESADKETGLTVSEQVKKALLDKEIDAAERVKNDLIRDQAKKISELTLALKNRPSVSMGNGGSGDSLEVKDNTFSEAQLAELRKKAERLKIDPEKFIERAKANLSKHR